MTSLFTRQKKSGDFNLFCLYCFRFMPNAFENPIKIFVGKSCLEGIKHTQGPGKDCGAALWVPKIAVAFSTIATTGIFSLRCWHFWFRQLHFRIIHPTAQLVPISFDRTCSAKIHYSANKSFPQIQNFEKAWSLTV